MIINIYSVEKSNISAMDWVKYILKNFYATDNAQILRSKNGKPYTPSIKLHFSVTHTKDRLFIAFCKTNIGIDAESLSRNIRYQSILHNFPKQERSEITNTREFLKHWVVKESFIKYMGGTIAQDLKKICYLNGNLTYQGTPTFAHVCFLENQGHILAVCSEEGEAEIKIIPLSASDIERHTNQ